MLPWVLATLTLLQLTSVAAQDPGPSGLSKLVSGLYARYAWVAVFSTTPPANAVPVAHASRLELQATFVPDLASAIWKDTQCAAKRREICTLDFDILFDSQDPSASELTVQGNGASEVLACFNVVGGARKCMLFVGAKVNGVARVADIVYSDQRSLRQLLGLTSKPTPKPKNATTGR